MRISRKMVVVALLLIVVFALPGCSVMKSAKKEEGVKVLDKTDTDGDGLYNYEEAGFGTDIYKKDTDGDGLSDYDETRKWNTDPNKYDTDGDGRSDGEEVAEGYDPNSKTGQLDSDNDGLGNVDEKKNDTDPEQADTDGDGFTDKQEVDVGRNPLDPYK